MSKSTTSAESGNPEKKRRRIWLDLTGQRYGRFTVVEESGRKGNCVAWLCKCDCGSMAVVSSNALRTGSIRSCGCLRRRGPGSIGPHRDRMNSEEVARRFHYNRGTSGAKKRKIRWLLTYEEFSDITGRPCHYCGAPPRSVRGNRRGEVKLNGLDRISSYLGYTTTNVVACCPACNFAKAAMTLEEFHAWVKRVYNHLFGTAV